MKNPPSTCERLSMYGGAVELLYHDALHRYYYEGKPVPGVTTITNNIAKNLTQWAADQACFYMLEHLKPGVVLDALSIQELLNGARLAHKKTLEKAGNIGHIVHAFAEGWIKGFNPKLPDDPKAQNGALAFLDWVKAHGVRFRESEKKVFSRKHRYAGTLDAESYFEDRRAIGDFKTSKGLWPEFRLQTAAYQYARAEETGEEYGPRWLARFDKETGEFEYKVLPVEDFEPDFEAFLGIKTVYHRLKAVDTYRRKDGSK